MLSLYRVFALRDLLRIGAMVVIVVVVIFDLFCLFLLAIVLQIQNNEY